MGKNITINTLRKFAMGMAEKCTTVFVKKESGKGLSSNDYTTAEKDKVKNLSNYTHANSGVTAGSYNKVTVNAQGHVTAGTNETAQSSAHKHTIADITDYEEATDADIDAIIAGTFKE